MDMNESNMAGGDSRGLDHHHQRGRQHPGDVYDEGDEGEVVEDEDEGVPAAKKERLDNSGFLHKNPYDSKYPSNFVKSFELSQRPVAITTIHELALDIIVVQFYDNLKFYTLALNEEAIGKFLNEKESGLVGGEGGKDMVRMKEILKSGEMPYPISSFAICSTSSFSFPPKMLIYALTLVEKELTTYLFRLDIERDELFPTYAFRDSSKIQNFRGYNAPITHLSFDDGGICLAALTLDPVLYIWELATQSKLSSFQLKSPGVAMAWHKSEPQKIMVVEREGWLKMFNLVKHLQIMSVNMISSPLLSGDWMFSNSLMIGLGAINSCFTVDLSKVNSGSNKMVEIKSGNVIGFKFSTNDPKVFAILQKPENEIKVFHQLYPHQPILSFRHKDIQDFIWVFGKPFILVLMGKEIVLFEARSSLV